MPRAPRMPPSITGQIAQAADREGPDFDTTVLALTLTMFRAATAFERAGALDRLEAFASFHGADFYRLPRNRGRVELRRERWTIPESLPFGEDDIVPLAGGEALDWRLLRSAVSGDADRR